MLGSFPNYVLACIPRAFERMQVVCKLLGRINVE